MASPQELKGPLHEIEIDLKEEEWIGDGIEKLQTYLQKHANFLIYLAQEESTPEQ